MNPLRPFEIIYPAVLKEHLRSIEAKHYQLIKNNIEDQLQYQPDIETRNRKPLKRPVALGAQGEVRFGPGNIFRAFYRVNREEHQVEILAIGVKKGSRLSIGGQEYEL